ncbi:hypothetical protein DFH09DRAFT_1128875, partial [Mycena vulgaris]
LPTPLAALAASFCGSTFSVPLDNTSFPRDYRHFLRLLRCRTVYLYAHIRRFGPRLSLSNPAGSISHADGPSFNQALVGVVSWLRRN